MPPATDDTAGSSSSSRAQNALGLLGLAVIVAGAFFLVRTSYRSLQGLKPEVAGAILTAITAVLVVVLGALANGFLARRQAAERSQQEKRVPVYEAFVKDLLDMLGATRPPDEREDITEAKVYEVMGPFTESVLVWGSDTVVKKWVEFRTEGGEATGYDQLFRMEELFLALRRDLGLSNRKLDRGDLLRLFVNDLPSDASTQSDQPKSRPSG